MLTRGFGSDVRPNGVGGSWNRDDIILVGNPSGGLVRYPASAGHSSLATRTTEPSEVHLFPSFLPDGRRFIYLRVYRRVPERSVGRLGVTAAAVRRLGR
jgi:hypothetical protein